MFLPFWRRPCWILHLESCIPDFENGLFLTYLTFLASIPLNTIFGFAEDYQKIIVNARHELILIRSRNYVNAVLQTADKQFKITM